MKKIHLGMNVFDAAVDRLRTLYRQGHRLVLSLSGGKDSTVCLELMILAAKAEGCLPVDVMFCDQEAVDPDTDAFLHRVANRKEVSMRWVVAQGFWLINAFNRSFPFFRAFDDEVAFSQWIRPLPKTAIKVGLGNIESHIDYEAYPVKDEENDWLFSVLGIRTQESFRRSMALASSKSYVTKHNAWGMRKCYPIYDWTDADVWLGIKRFGWDYSKAYDKMYQLGFNRKDLRIGPPTLSTSSIDRLMLSKRIWPNWFEKMALRLPGINEVTVFGKEWITPNRQFKESWEQCYVRTCINDAPKWISERAILVRQKAIAKHAAHSSDPLPESKPCMRCPELFGSWRALTNGMWSGDPASIFCGKQYGLKPVDPEHLRTKAVSNG